MALQRPRLKLAIRHLPPTWTKEDFLALISPYDASIDYHEFSPGKPGSNPNPLLSLNHSEKPAKPSCGYVAFKDPKALIEFAKRVHGIKVLDGMGMEYEVEVMVAIHQGYTTQADPKDPLSGTIEDNPLYQEWLKGRETKKADPVTVEAMQNLPKETRTSALVEEVRKKMDKDKGAIKSDLNGGKKKKKKKKKGKGKDGNVPPSTTIEQPKPQPVIEQKPQVFKIISRRSLAESKPTTIGSNSNEPTLQQNIISDQPVGQEKAPVSKPKKHAIPEGIAGAETPTEHPNSALNPSSTPFPAITTPQSGTPKVDKSGSKKFMTLSSKSPTLSPTLASTTESLAKVKIDDKDDKSHSIAIVKNESPQKAEPSNQAPPPPLPPTTDKAIDKPKKKSPTKAVIPETKRDERDDKSTPKDKQHTTRYYSSDTNNPSKGSKGKKKGKGPTKVTSHDVKDKDSLWFIDIPEVKQQSGAAKIASFNLPSLRQTHSKSAISREMTSGEHQEVVVMVPVKSDFIPSTQHSSKSEASSLPPNTVEKQGKSPNKDSATTQSEVEWQKKYDALMASKPNKCDAPPSPSNQ